VLHDPGEREFLIGLLLLALWLEIAPATGGDGLWLNPATGFDFLLPGLDGGHELWIGRCQPCRRDSGELAIEPMNAAAESETGAVGDGAAEEECGEAVSQHGAQQGLGGMGLHRRRGEEPSPHARGSAGWAKGGEAACVALDAAGGASPRTQRSAAGSPGHHGLRFARSDAPDL